MTKKVLSALSVFFIFIIFTGCGNSGRKAAVTDFSADFTAVYKDLNLGGKITADRRGLLSIELNNPATLDGVMISYKNGETELKKDGLICTADEAFIPKSGFPALMKTALNALNKEVYSSKTPPNSGKYELEADGTQIFITTDENGFISKISVGGELEIEFSGVVTAGNG